MNTVIDSQHQFLTHPWYSMGEAIPGECGLCINETATRARAGLLNILSGTTIFLLLAAPELDPVRYVAPFVIFEMVSAAIFGLTPVSPAGIIGTVLTMKIRPVWKPIKPKRFAWTLGAALGVCCLTFPVDYRGSGDMLHPHLARGRHGILCRLLDVFPAGQM
jgi:hypothetical protein